MNAREMIGILRVPARDEKEGGSEESMHMRTLSLAITTSLLVALAGLASAGEGTTKVVGGTTQTNA